MPEEPSTVEVRGEEKALLALLDSFAKLESGWNGYSAPVPSCAAIDNAKKLVNEAFATETFPDRVELSAIGGVGVAFTAGNREVVVEFYNNKTAHSLFADNATHEMDTRPVSPYLNSYQELLSDVGKFLHVTQPAHHYRSE